MRTGFIYVKVTLMSAVLGVCIAALKDKPEGAWSKGVIDVTRIAPSIWPIVFSGILGNSIRTLADWQLERGISLLVWILTALRRQRC